MAGRRVHFVGDAERDEDSLHRPAFLVEDLGDQPLREGGADLRLLARAAGGADVRGFRDDVAEENRAVGPIPTAGREPGVGDRGGVGQRVGAATATAAATTVREVSAFAAAGPAPAATTAAATTATTFSARAAAARPVEVVLELAAGATAVAAHLPFAVVAGGQVVAGGTSVAAVAATDRFAERFRAAAATTAATGDDDGEFADFEPAAATAASAVVRLLGVRGSLVAAAAVAVAATATATVVTAGAADEHVQLVPGEAGEVGADDAAVAAFAGGAMRTAGTRPTRRAFDRDVRVLDAFRKGRMLRVAGALEAFLAHGGDRDHAGAFQRAGEIDGIARARSGERVAAGPAGPGERRAVAGEQFTSPAAAVPAQVVAAAAPAAAAHRVVGVLLGGTAATAFVVDSVFDLAARARFVTLSLEAGLRRVAAGAARAAVVVGQRDVLAAAAATTAAANDQRFAGGPGGRRAGARALAPGAHRHRARATAAAAVEGARRVVGGGPFVAAAGVAPAAAAASVLADPDRQLLAGRDF